MAHESRNGKDAQGFCRKCGRWVYPATSKNKPSVDSPCMGDLDPLALVFASMQKLVTKVNPYYVDGRTGYSVCQHCNALQGEAHARACPMSVQLQLREAFVELGIDPDAVQAATDQFMKGEADETA